VIVREFKPYLF
jgi:membrane-associated phospholipid phosphatase